MGAGLYVQAAPTDLPEMTVDKNNPKYYLIKNVRKGKYAAYSGAASSMTQVAEGKADSTKFYFVGNVAEGVATVKIYNEKADRENLACAETNSWTAEGRDWYISAKTENGLSISKDPKFEGNNSWNDFQGSGLTVDYWNATDPGSIWVVEDPNAVIVDVTYTYYLDGKEVKKEVVKQRVGENYSAPVAFSFTTNTYENDNKIAEDNKDIRVNCVENLPFLKSKSFETANWHYLTISANKLYLSHVDGQDAIALNRSTTPNFPEEMKSEDMWCFVGNVVDGFTIYNKVAGANKILSSTTELNGNNDGTVYPILKDPSTLTDKDNKTWDISASSHIAGGFYIAQHGNQANAMNKRGDKLAYWVGGKDAGSTFLTTAVPTDKDILTNYVGVAKNTAGYVGGYTKEQVAAMEQLKTLDELRTFIKGQSRVALDANKMYRIKNVMRGGTFWMQDGTQFTNGTWDMSSADMLWKLVAVDGVDGGYNIQIVNSGNVLSVKSGETTSSLFSLVELGDAQYAIKWNNTDQCYAQYERGGIGFWNTPAKGNDQAWYFVPAEGLEVAMNTAEDNTWSSLYLPFDVTLPEGLEAYTGVVSSSEGVASLHMDKVADVPANTGVILKGTAEKYMLNIAKASAVVEVGNNELKGTNVAIPLTMEDPDAPGETIEMADRCYVLGYTEANGLGLYNPAGDKLLANKAYLPVMNAMDVNCIKLVFGDVTGVEGVEAATDKADVYYDLSGRRVAHPAKGIYVKNGQKVYVK